MLNLEGQVAIVSGGGTGLGQSIALAFAAAGMRVAISGRRQQPLDDTLARIHENGGQALAVQCDVSQEADVERLVQTTLDQYGTVDVLVNNAGIAGGDALHKHDVEKWDQIIAVNLRGPFLLSRAVLPIMRDKRSGHIIMISSIAGVEYPLGFGAYAVSKHGLNAMAEIMQRENQDLGIHVEVVCPGWVVTEMTEGVNLNHDTSLIPDDVADLVMWLVSRRPNVKISGPVVIRTMANPLPDDSQMEIY